MVIAPRPAVVLRVGQLDTVGLQLLGQTKYVSDVAVGTVGEDHGILAGDGLLIVVAVGYPTLNLATAQTAVVHLHVKGMLVVVTLRLGAQGLDESVRENVIIALDSHLQPIHAHFHTALLDDVPAPTRRPAGLDSCY